MPGKIKIIVIKRMAVEKTIEEKQLLH